MEDKPKYHAEWMDEPYIDVHEFEATQLHVYDGKYYLAARSKNGDAMYQKWHVPVKKQRGGGEYLGTLKEKRMTSVMIGKTLEEAEAVLEFFLDNIRQRMADAKERTANPRK